MTFLLIFSAIIHSVWSECVLFEEAAINPVRNHLEANLIIPDHVRIEFDITMNSLPRSWASILHCGSVDGIRQPGLWLHPSSGTQSATFKGIHTSYSKVGNGNPWINPTDAMEIGRKYNFVVEVGPNSMVVTWDGREVYSNLNYGAHNTFNGGTQPCYISDPWYDAADVLLENVKISQITDGDCVPAPTPRPIESEYNYCEEGLVLLEKEKLGAPLLQNSVPQYIEIGDEMQVSFEFIVYSFPTTNVWENIMHCGQNDGIRQPGIWLHRDSGTSGAGFAGLHISYSQTSNGNPWINPIPALELNRKYYFELQVTQSSLVVTLDGTEVYRNDAYLRHNVYSSQPCYFSDPWYPGANVELFNVQITEPDPNCVTRRYKAIVVDSVGDGLTFDAANTRCNEAFGTELATIESVDDAKEALAVRRASDAPEGHFWIGLNDRNTEHRWEYLDGSHCGNIECVSLPFWAPGEPNDAGSGEDCVHIWNGNRAIEDMLNDLPCDRTEISGLPMNALCNYPDNQYVALSDSNGVNFYEAEEKCEKELGTQLAIIRNTEDAEHALAARDLLSDSTIPLWIGLTDANGEGVWKFIDGTDCDGSSCDGQNLEVWSPNEPNNANGEDCAHIWPGQPVADALLNDIHCEQRDFSGKFGALCEAPADDECDASNLDRELIACSTRYPALVEKVTANEAGISQNTASVADNSVKITENAADISSNAGKIQTNIDGITALSQGDVATNAGNINTNAADITANAQDIGTNAADITTNAADIGTNTAKIAELETKLENLKVVVGDGDALIGPQDIQFGNKDTMILGLLAFNLLTLMIAVYLCFNSEAKKQAKYVQVKSVYSSEDEENLRLN